jgi:hypothetical protein
VEGILLDIIHHSAQSRRDSLETWVNEVFWIPVLIELNVCLGSFIEFAAILRTNGAVRYLSILTYSGVRRLRALVTTMCWSRSVASDALGFDARRIAISAKSGMLEQKRSKKVCGENVLPLLIVNRCCQ